MPPAPLTPTPVQKERLRPQGKRIGSQGFKHKVSVPLRCSDQGNKGNEEEACGGLGWPLKPATLQWSQTCLWGFGEVSQRSGGVAEASGSPQRPLVFQTKGLLLSWQAERPLVSTEYQPEVQRLPAAGTSPQLPPQIHNPPKSPVQWEREVIFHGPAALQSPPTYWKV